jgi:hypothetical protein
MPVGSQLGSLLLGLHSETSVQWTLKDIFAGEELAELLMSGQLAFMLAKSVAWSASLQAALNTLATSFRQACV